MKLSEAIERLAVATRANLRSPRTVQAYREKCGTLLDFLGDVEVKEITVDDLRRYIASLVDAELSPFTVKTLIQHIKRLFNFLDEEGFLADNPSDRIRTPDPKRKKPKGVLGADVKALLQDVKGDSLYDLRDRAAILFLADTGARAAGVCGLQLEDLDLEEGLASVTEKRGKTRFVMFTEPTAEALRAWIEAVEIEEGPVFLGLGPRSEGALTPNGLGQMLRRRSERAGCKGPTNPHAFRHGFARHYLLDGGDLGTLSNILGHEDVAITVEYYGVFLVNEMKAVHDQHSPVTSILEQNNGQK